MAITINKQTTFNELEIELGELGIDSISWSSTRGRHVVEFYGPDYKKGCQGFGKTFTDAVDDAFTNAVQTLGSMLIKVD